MRIYEKYVPDNPLYLELEYGILNSFKDKADDVKMWGLKILLYDFK